MPTKAKNTKRDKVASYVTMGKDTVVYSSLAGRVDPDVTPPFDLANQEFRFIALRPGMGRLNIGPMVTNVQWRDEGAEDNINTIPVLRGTITMTKPADDQTGAKIDLRDGHRVRCETKVGGSWEPLWEMRITSPQLGLSDGQWDFEMADDLVLVSQSVGDFKYKRGKKKRTKGWRYDEIVRDICRKYRIPVIRMVRGKYKIKSFHQKDVSPLEAIRQALAQEQKWTGFRYVIRWAYSKAAGRFGLSITYLRANPLLYLLRDQIVGGSIETVRKGTMATAITARGSGRKGGDPGGAKPTGKRKKYKAEVRSKEGIRQYGYMHKSVQIDGNIDSQAELVRKAERWLARHLEPKNTVSLEHYGMAFVRRGDAVKIKVPQLAPKQQVMYVVGVLHNLTPGSYQMSLTLTLKNPLDPVKLRKDREAALKRQKKATKKKDDG